MSLNQKQRLEADRRRAEFLQTASSVSDQLRPMVLLDDFVGALDPEFVFLRRMQSVAKRNPFAILAAVGGVWLLTQQLKRNAPKEKSSTRRGSQAFRLSSTTSKGEENGYVHSSKQS
jgi:hypothetical protein